MEKRVELLLWLVVTDPKAPRTVNIAWIFSTETVPSTLPAVPTRYSRAPWQHAVLPAPLRPRGRMAWSCRCVSRAP